MTVPDSDSTGDFEPRVESAPDESQSLADTEGDLQHFLGSDQHGGEGWHEVEGQLPDRVRWREVDDTDRLDLAKEH